MSRRPRPERAHDETACRHRQATQRPDAPICQLYRADGRLVLYVQRLSEPDYIWLRDAMLSNGQGNWHEARAKAGAFIKGSISHFGIIHIDLHREDIDAFVAMVSHRLGCEVNWLEAPPDWPR